MSLLLLVAVAYLVTQMLLFERSRYVSFDEAQYLSQVSRGVPATNLGVHATRAVSVLAAPASLPGGSIGAVRMWFATLSAVMLFLAFRAWIPLVGAAAVLAAFLFGFSWLALFYGSEAMPNLPAALVFVAAAAMAVRDLSAARAGRAAVASAALIAAAGFFRPLEAMSFGAALALCVLWRRRGVAGRLAVLAAGVALGWVPWVMGSLGGPKGGLGSLGTASRTHVGPLHSNLLQHLSLTDGPVHGPEQVTAIPWPGLAWWLGLLVFAVAGVAARRGKLESRAAPVALLTGVSLLLPHLFLSRPVNPRYLLPAYGLLGISAATGVIALVRRMANRRAVAVAIVAALLGPWLGWHVATANRIEEDVRARRVVLRELADALRARAAGASCAFASQNGWTQIQFGSGCVGRELSPETLLQIDSLSGVKVFALARAAPAGTQLLRSWRVTRLHLPQAPGWKLYERPSR